MLFAMDFIYITLTNVRCWFGVYTLFCSGDETGGETPVLIPNTAVKTSRGDGTALCGRVARRQYKVV